MKTKDIGTKTHSKPPALPARKNSDKPQASPPPASFQEVNRLRRPKQTLASQIKNFFDPTRAQRKQQQWDQISKAEDKRVADWNKVRVSTPFDASINEKPIVRSGEFFVEYHQPRIDEIRQAIKQHGQNDFSKALFRTDGLSPREWVNENKAVLAGTVKLMHAKADNYKDLAKISDKQKLELAEAAWKTLFTDPPSTNKVPGKTKALLGELVREVKNSPQFSNLSHAEQREVIRGVVNYGFNTKGVQALLQENDRFTELRFQPNGITERPEKSLTSDELEEKRGLEAKVGVMRAVVAGYGNHVLGIKAANKDAPAWLTLSDSMKSSGAAFFDKLVDESIALADQAPKSAKPTAEDESSLVESSDESSLVESSDESSLVESGEESVRVEVGGNPSKRSENGTKRSAPFSNTGSVHENKLYEDKVRGGENPLYIPKKD